MHERSEAEPVTWRVRRRGLGARPVGDRGSLLRGVASALVAALVASLAAVVVVPAGRAAASNYEGTSTSTTSVADFPAWMAAIPDQVTLDQISLPGTHESMTWACGTFASKWCDAQSMDTDAQLDSGIRLFDVRLRQENNGTKTYKQDDYYVVAHGQEDLWNGNDKLTLTVVLDDVCSWVQRHPSETVVLRLTDNGTYKHHDSWIKPKGTGEAAFILALGELLERQLDLFSTCLIEDGDWINQRSLPEVWPTLGDARGRVVVSVGGNAEGGFPDDGWSDYFGPSTTWETSDAGTQIDMNQSKVQERMDEITRFMSETNGSTSGKVRVTQINANGFCCSPWVFANGDEFDVQRGFNERTIEWLLGLETIEGRSGLDVGHTGAVWFDFPDEAMIASVLIRNLDLMLSNANLGTDLRTGLGEDLGSMMRSFLHHVMDQYGEDVATATARSAMDAVLTTALGAPTFQSLTITDKDLMQAQTYLRTNEANVIELNTDWVHQRTLYRAWVPAEAWAPVLSDANQARFEDLVANLVLSPEVTERADQITTAVAGEFPDHTVHTLTYLWCTEEGRYDLFRLTTLSGVPLAHHNPTPNDLGTCFGPLQWQSVAWLTGGPTTPTAQIDASTTRAIEGEPIVLDGSSSNRAVWRATNSYCWRWTSAVGCDSTDALLELPPIDGPAVVDVTLDVDNGFATDTAATTIVVDNVPPVLDLPAETTGGEQGTSVIVLDAPDPTDEVRVMIDWGDGSPLVDELVDGNALSEFPHQWASNPPGVDEIVYDVTVALVDDDGASTIAMMHVTVRSGIPVVQILQPTTELDEGGAFVMQWQVFDPNNNGTSTVVFDWGDGSEPYDLTFDGEPPAQAAYINHVYADDPPASFRDEYRVKVTVTDGSGQSSSDSVRVGVRNVAPIMAAPELVDPRGNSIGADIEDVTFSGMPVVLSASFDDPGALDTHVSRVVWGDGTSTGVVPGAVSPVTDTHRYATLGDVELVVDVRDDDDGVGSARRTISVLDPAGGVQRVARSIQDVIDGASGFTPVAELTAARDLLIAGRRSALAEIEAGSGDLTPLRDAVAILSDLGMLSNAEVLALVASAMVYARASEAQPLIDRRSETRALQLAASARAVGDASDPVTAMAHYQEALDLLSRIK